MLFRFANFLAICFLWFCYSDRNVRQVMQREQDSAVNIGPLDDTPYRPLRPYVGQDDSTDGPYNYSQYQPWAKMVKELKRIASLSDENVNRTMFSIGKTFEDRTLWAIKFQYIKEDEDRDETKKTIVVDCGAHAREWIAPSTCMHLINELSPPKETLLPVLKRFDWVIIPLLNPDGYVYSWKDSKTRMWRKNRSFTPEQLKKYKDTKDPLCIGVDINRNFNKAWGGKGAPIHDPCYEMYAGSEPFSEKESRALADYLRSMKDKTIAYVTLHCYGQHWMTPWGFTTTRPGEYKEMKRVAKLAVKSMRTFSGVIYTVGTSHDELYPNSGSSTDWAYDNLKTPYTYIVEMLPADDTPASFKVPPAMMVKNAKDVEQGILTMAKNLKEEKVE